MLKQKFAKNILLVLKDTLETLLESHLQTLFDLGFDRVSYGIQDFDDQVQVAINRHQSFEEYKCS